MSPQVKESRRGASARRRRAFFLNRIDAAETPQRRLIAAVDYARAVLASKAGGDAERFADVAVDWLTDYAEGGLSDVA